MPNKCAVCGRAYDAYAIELVKGCECGSNIFIYQKAPVSQTVVRRPVLASVPKGAAPGPAAFDTREVVTKVEDAVQKLESGEKSSEVEFDLEAIRVIEEGVYDINVAKLVRKEPLIVEIKEDGKYFVHLASLFKKTMEIEDEALTVKEKK